MAMIETLSAFFDTADFAVAATYNTATVNGIFSHEYVDIEGVEGERPTFTCVESDVSGIAHGDALTVNATVYTIAGVQPDGTGIVLLVLSE